MNAPIDRIVRCTAGMGLLLFWQTPIRGASGQPESAPPPASPAEAPVSPGGLKNADRRLFASMMAKIAPAMAAAEVTAILGAPDEVRAINKPYAMSSRGIGVQVTVKEVWRYGADDDLSSATLGRVYMDDNDQVVEARGGNGEAPPAGMFAEGELRRLLRVLDQVPSYQSNHNTDPGNIIRAVNLLQPLGKARALAVMKEYLRVTPETPVESTNGGYILGIGGIPGRDGIFLVLQTLFEVPSDPGYLPSIFADSPPRGAQRPGTEQRGRVTYQPLEPMSRAAAPRYPISLYGDIPFLTVNAERIGLFDVADMSQGFSLVRGLARTRIKPEEHLAYFSAYGTLRAKPLVPSLRPWDAVEQFLAEHPEQAYMESELFNQVMQMIYTVYRGEKNQFSASAPAPSMGQEHDAIVQAITKLDLHWDAAASRYTLADGQMLEIETPEKYHPLLWEITAAEAGAKQTVTLRRLNDQSIGVEFGGGNHQAFTFRILAKDQVLEVAAENRGPTYLIGQGWHKMRIKAGEPMVVEYSDGVKVIRSPTLTP